MAGPFPRPKAKGVHSVKSYELSAEEVLQQENASPDGLSSQEAARRLEEHGPNKLKDNRP